MASTPEDHPDPGPPLWSIGFVVALILGTPLLIYTLAPTGPIREGDTVFSEGSAKAVLAHPLLFQTRKFDGTCLLDPQDPLMVLQRPSDRPDGMALVKVQGKIAIEWPFCPPQAELLVATSYLVQKQDLLAELRKRLGEEWWRR